MTSYGQLFLTILPVFALIGLGLLLRRAGWIAAEAENTMLNLVVKVAFPCLIFDLVLSNAAVQRPENVVMPPLVGFGLSVASMAVAWGVGRALGLKRGAGLRTFALTTGLTNYGYLPLPIMSAAFGPDSRAVLFIHNIGVEAAIWTAGILLLSGDSLWSGWRRLLNMPLAALAVALTLNLSGAAVYVPQFFIDLTRSLGACAVPLGLLMSGSSIEPYLHQPRQLVAPRVAIIACVVRLGLLAVMFLAVAKWLPLSPELKRVVLVQAAMPTAVTPIILARVYGGQPLVAVQIVLATTVVALFTIPLWLEFGQRWLGL